MLLLAYSIPNHATCKTLTINGPIEAQPYQTFSCTGTGKVVFGSQKVVYPEWWGAVINASENDCGLALMTWVRYRFKEMPNGLCRIGFLDKSPDAMPY